MKTLIRTTASDSKKEVRNATFAGNYAGELDIEAFEIINDLYEDELSFLSSQWCDIMKDESGEKYAVYATGALTCPDTEVLYIEL